MRLLDWNAIAGKTIFRIHTVSSAEIVLYFTDGTSVQMQAVARDSGHCCLSMSDRTLTEIW